MKRRLFTDFDVTPTDSILRKKLGPAMDYYVGIVSTSGNYRKQWQYNRGNGWILKVDDMRRALFYLIAFEDGIEVSLTVRESERAELLKNDDLRDILVQLESGTKYPEGYALRFGIESTDQCRSVSRFIETLIRLRDAHGARERVSAAKTRQAPAKKAR
jgi:hypothetical protein